MKRKRFFQTLKAQLLMYMVLLLATALLFTAVLSSYFTGKALDEQSNDFTAQMLEQIQTNIDSFVATSQNIIQYLCENDAVVGFLRLDSFYDASRVELETAAREAMHVYVRGNPELIGGMLVVGENGLYVSGEMYRASRHSLLKENWYRLAREAEGDFVLLSKPIGRNLRNYRNYSAMDIVSLVRAVYDPDGGEFLGVICMDLQLSVMEEYIRNITLGKDGYVFIIDAEEEIVYAPMNETAYRIRAQWLQSGNGRLYQIGDNRYQLLSSHSPLTNWRIVGVFNSATVLEPVAQIRQYSIFIGLAVILVASVASIFFSATFTRPISRIKQLMQKAAKGDLTVSFDDQNHCDEITELGLGFNTMIDQLHYLMDQVVQEQQLKREADIKTLQAQIKPHFLYNTLDTIRWMADEHQAEDISLLVRSLTKLFRIGLSRGHEIINLSEELEHVRNYLYIQQVRYENKLSYVIECEEALLNCKVNKLILQPLVENAIYHGIKQKHGMGTVTITAEETGEKLVLSVMDDGVGMAEEQRNALNQALRDETQTAYQHGYGIFNVNDRIRLTHGSAYGLFYHVNPAGGVTAQVILPLQPTASIAEMERSIREASLHVEDSHRG